MTESIYFDTDCLSAFLWVGRQDIITDTYDNKIIVPKQVFTELSSPYVINLKNNFNKFLHSKNVEIYDMLVDSDEYKLFSKLTNSPDDYKIIGDGEAASISLAKTYKGIMASNNLKDINYYIKKFKLKNITTGDILIEALEKNVITQIEGDKIWSNMLSKKRRIGAASFSEYLSNKK